VRPWVANTVLKLVALFLAIVLWFFVSAPRRERVSERAFSVPLSLIALPPSMVITTPVPTNVSVRLRGRGADLRALSSQALEVTVEMSWAQPGDAVITLTPRAIAVPPEVEVLSLEPNKVQFRVEALRQRSLPIRAFLVGQPPAGYFVGDPTVEPPRALVSGPESQLRKMREVATERIIMTGRTETFVQDVPLVSDSAHVRLVSPLTTQVTVPVIAEVGPSLPSTATDVITETVEADTPTPATTSQEAIPEEEPRRRKRP
jgi:YbbR domain-containing protein